MTHYRACRPRYVFLLLFFVVAFTAGAQSGKPLRLFMIGNSFSQNASKFLPQLSKEGGHSLVIGRAEIGGSSLQRHWEHAEAAEKDPNDPKGKPYSGKSLKDLLSAGTWDVVTIQQASILSGDSSTYQPYARKLYDFVKKLQPQAQIVFHQTWAYRTDSKDFSRISPNDSARNARQMWQASRAAYHATAGALGVPVIPNGDAFYRISSSRKWGYRAKQPVNPAQLKAPVLPDQTHSLHVGYRWDKDKLAFDSHHANDAGCLLGGLVWYSFLFNESPEKLTFRPETVDEAFAGQLRKTAWKTVLKTRSKAKHTWTLAR
ncbi:DUF4886 domain-containing protein [Arsenicibacter rosenii]|uniref:DUF4886 domain-containing protein n=1 Tax=Arsenicibacter rosenii TaxID=1750698 RepID=A0A1S2VC92_9BACT|nr:DUF4886 domain-containing protein [Arsenicibacter rosenii]OIN55935.1 DUF4886 domain-containing protein [Arsenicibacter rosenii]